MPLIVPNIRSLIEEATSLDLQSVVNSAPVLNVGSRRYDIIYTSHLNNAPHLYALEYNGNEVALARLRKVFALHPDTVETSTLFIRKHKEPIDEGNVKEYAGQMGSHSCNSDSADQNPIHFHLLEGKIPENYGSLDDYETKDCIPSQQLISQLPGLVQPWS